MSVVFSRIVFLTVLGLVLFAGIASAGNPVCAACGKPITENNWVTVDGKDFHKDCFRCAYCGRILDISGEISRYEGKYYHRHCYLDNILPKCCVCNRPLEGTYFVDSRGNKFCAEHKDKVPLCAYCGRIIAESSTGGGVTYSDGRHVCNLCRGTAVDDTDAVMKNLREVRGILAGINIDVDLADVEVVLVNKARMMGELAQSENTPGITKTTYTRQNNDLAEMTHTIYMLHGMPRMYFNQVLAHELMHVWINRRHTVELIDGHDESKAFIEGSCNYAAYLVLRSYGSDEADYYAGKMMSNDDIHYGLGFREVKDFVDSFNINYWLAYLKDHNHLPGR